MLGDQVGEEKGKITSQRVLDVEAGTPKMETSFSATGKYRGVEATEMGTYWSTPRPGGALHGEGQGVLMSKDGRTGNGDLDRPGSGTIYQSRKNKIRWVVIL